MAGGTDLLSELKDAILPDYPEVIVNLKNIHTLNKIKEDSRELKIGALVRLADIATSPVINKHFPILAEAALAVATPQIRNIGTIGGNICQDVRCWYYRYPHQAGGHIMCYFKGGSRCYALNGENEYHSIFGGIRIGSTACSRACPGHVNIASYFSDIRGKDLRRAARELMAMNPIPAITGRVCPSLCEEQCARSEYDEPVSIRDVERFVGDYILMNSDELISPPSVNTGKMIAVIGSGPAGLSAAYYLRMSGHNVTVFERLEEAGGMLRYGIPPHRLPNEIVSKVVGMCQKAGIEFRLNTEVGRNINLADIKKEYDITIIATGAWGQPPVSFAGNELTQSGLELLNRVNRGEKVTPGKKVVVIGGGNVAVDVAITAKRLGAKDVTIACLESRKEMPALESEIQEAVKEGINILPSYGPYQVIASGDKVIGIEMMRCKSVLDSEGRFAPVYDEKVTETVVADRIYCAIGQRPDLTFINGYLPLNVHGLIQVDQNTQETSIPGIFACGEVTIGRGTVIEAIAAGRKAALAINKYFNCTETKSYIEAEEEEPVFISYDAACMNKSSRTPLPPISSQELIGGFGLSEAGLEANRCFNCSCLAVNTSDIAVALLTLGASLRIQGAASTREVMVDEFFGFGKNVLHDEEVVTEIRIPLQPAGAIQKYVKFRLRQAIDFPIVSIGLLLNIKNGICEQARIAMGAVAPKPVRSLAAELAIQGKFLDETAAEAAAEAVMRNTMPLGKNAHKVQILRTLVKKAILATNEK